MFHAKRIILFLMIAVFALYLSFASTAGEKYRESEILVKFKPGARANLVSAALGARLDRSLPRIEVHSLTLKPGRSVEDAVAKFRKNPNVVWAAPNHVVRLATTIPNDEWFEGQEFCIPELEICVPLGGQWGLYNTEGRHDIHAPEAWDLGQGSDATIIAVVDTGIQSYHWDLAGRVIDGYNALDDSSDTDDDHMHGTFVASVAAANTNNEDGIAGVDWNALLMPIKVLDSTGEGTEAGAAEGIIWAADHGAKIINMSFGSYDHVQALEDAVNYAWSAGCLVVAASGNDNLDDATDRHYPSYYPVCISVGASNEYDQRCTPMDWLLGGSNYGDSLDVIAPGNNIYGAVPGYYDEWLGEWTEYEAMAGTSAAAPFVSGLAGLIWAYNPTWDNQQVRDQIERSCDDIGTAGWDRFTGWGRINAYKALSEAPIAVSSIGEALGQPDGADVMLPGRVVTAGIPEFADRFYIEEADRSAGIMVYCGSGTSITAAIGDKVKVTGAVSTVNGERALITPLVASDGIGVVPRALGMPARAVGGALGSYGGQTPGVGLSNSALLVRVWGRVKSVGWNYFYIEDGSGLIDGSGFQGLKVFAGNAPNPAVGDYLSVTGISSVESPPGTGVVLPVIRVRTADDVRKLN